MFNKGDYVKCLPLNPFYSILGGDTGQVTGSYYKGNEQFISVLFNEYGAEQGYVSASLYRNTLFTSTTISDIATSSKGVQGDSGLQGIQGIAGTISDEYLISSASSLIQTQSIYAQFILSGTL